MSEEEQNNLTNELMSKLGMDNDNIQTMSMQEMMAQKSADQEILTFDFLKQVVVANAGDEGLHWQDMTLEQYHQDTGNIKMQFSLFALNFLTHEKRNALMQEQVWSAPYGYFYMWQFAINGLQYFIDNEAALNVIKELFETVAQDYSSELDYGRFNHFGRILAISKFLIYSASNKNKTIEEIQEILFTKLMGSVQKQKDDELSKGANGENENLRDVEVEACEMSIRVLDALQTPLLASAYLYHLDSNSEDGFKKLEWGIQSALEFVEALKSEDWTGERTKLFADIEKDLNDMHAFIQPQEEPSAEDVMSQLEALMNQLKEENPETYAKVEKRAKVMELVNSPLPTPEENHARLKELDLLDTYIEMVEDGSFSDKKEVQSNSVDISIDMELSTAMWQAGRYTSFHYWLGDYPEGSANYNNLHDNMIPKYKATKQSFEAKATGIITYEDLTKQINANLDGYALDGGEFSTNEVKTMITDYISDIEKGDSFDLIANYPALIYQFGVTSATFDNGCKVDSAPDYIKKHCDRWGWVMTRKIDWFNDIATGLIS